MIYDGSILAIYMNGAHTKFQREIKKRIILLRIEEHITVLKKVTL